MSQLINCNDLATCFQDIYNLIFAIFLAFSFLYFIFGALQYLLSGLGTLSVEEGKRKMKNSIIAVIIVLTIPVIISLINPEIFKGSQVEMPIFTVTVNIESIAGTLPGSDITVDNRKLPLLKEKSLDEIIEKLNKMSNYANPKNLSRLLNDSRTSVNIDDRKLKILASLVFLESRGDSFKRSSYDVCLDGFPFSIGLFQINMAVRNLGAIGYPECDCRRIFTFQGSNNRNNCNLRKYGNRYNCRVKDQNLYQKCVKILQDPTNNVKMAFAISGGWKNLNPWTGYKILKKKGLASVKTLDELLASFQALFQIKKLEEIKIPWL